MARKIFESVQTDKIKKSGFDLSHDKKLSLKFGKLYPVLCEEILPGDRYRCETDILMKTAPLIAPMMHRVDIKTRSFFVPSRIIWSQSEQFFTGGKMGDVELSTPKVELNGDADFPTGEKGGVADYFGIPVGSNADSPPSGWNGIDINALPFRAYAKIWNEYFRDQNLTDEIDYESAAWADGTDEVNFDTILPVCWEKDYFTAALPFSQRGPQVDIPMEGEATFSPQYRAIGQIVDDNGDPTNVQAPLTVDGNEMFADTTPPTDINVKNLVDPQTINTSSLIGTIRELRRATSLQHFFELAAQIGARYIEQIYAYFGVRSSDARMQRPEYLGGGASPLVISEVLNTSATATEPQGNRSGLGMAAGGRHGFGFDGRYRKGYFAEEHGYIITVMYVLPKTAYQNGLHRMWTRDNRFDFGWPQFAHIGEQEVFDHELYQNPVDPLDKGTFGYQDRYAEYKYKECSVHGDFRDDLDFWHMGRILPDGNHPLNSDFVQADPTTRIFAVQDDSDYLYAHVYHKLTARRPLPFFSNPRLM